MQNNDTLQTARSRYKKGADPLEGAENAILYLKKEDAFTNSLYNDALFCFYENITKALVQGGKLSDLRASDGQLIKDIPDLSSIEIDNIEFDDKTILQTKTPDFIPCLNQQILERSQYILNAIQLFDENDSYLVAVNGSRSGRFKASDKELLGYVIMNLDQIVLTQQYFVIRARAKAKVEAKKAEVARKKSFDKLIENTAEHAANNETIISLILSNLSWSKKYKAQNDPKFKEANYKEKIKYIFDKLYLGGKVKSNRVSTKKSSSSMSRTTWTLYKYFIDDRVSDRSNVEAQTGLWSWWKKHLELIQQKYDDLDARRIDLSGSRAKGNETSFGDSNTVNRLYKKHGILVKRQDGKEITDQQVEQIAKAWKSFEEEMEVKLSNAAKKFKLKVVHASKTLVYARKAAGIFYPYFRVVTTTNKYGDYHFNSILAHELGHWMDYMSNEGAKGRFLSDDYSSIAGRIAFEFRKNMNQRSSSKYINSTVECFARAIQQFFVYRKYGKDSKGGYIYGTDNESLAEPIDTQPFYVRETHFVRIIEPMIVEFIKQFRKRFGIGDPKCILQTKLKGFRAALDFAEGKAKETLETKIKGFEAALKFI